MWSTARPGEPRLLKQFSNPKGYRKVGNHYVHRLVWQAWRGAIPAGLQIRHMDGDPGNNVLQNLRPGTSAENTEDRRRHGTMPLGETHRNSVLTSEQVTQARRLFRDGYRLGEIQAILKVDTVNATLHDAIVGKTWAHLPEAPVEIAQPRPRLERFVTCPCGMETSTPRRGMCQRCYRKEMRSP